MVKLSFLSLISCLCLTTGTSAFHVPVLSQSRASAVARPHSFLRTVSTNNDADTTTTPFVAKAPKQPKNQIDATIYKFNKILIDSVYNLVCLLYPVKGANQDAFTRFFVLETVARVPYFAYLTVLHFRETFGERDLEYKMRAHYAEADNEFHHLLIMEELGGGERTVDGWVAHTMAFLYYWYVVVVYLISEQAAYHLSELIEDHAFNTYNGFLKEHGEELKQMPVPKVAQQYYCEDNPVWLDLFHVKDSVKDRNFNARQTKLESLYDVFQHVRDDEKEHWMALCNLVQYGDIQGADASLVQSTEPMEAVSR